MALAVSRYAGQNEPGLYLVYPQDPGQARACTCDIFVVHGLRGGATKTWQNQRSGTIWFQHLLPDYIRSQTNSDAARIWTYGYPADVTFQAATIYGLSLALLSRVHGVRDGEENRRIIWVCHSLGGIIVKDALVEAALTDTFRSIYTSTVGIVFLATPHQGSGAANLGSIVASVVDAVTPGISIFNRNALRELRRGSDALFEISSRFSRISAGISIHTFYETGGAHLIVDRLSAVLNVPNEATRYPLRVTHQEMGRFLDGYDSNWPPVAASIVALVRLATAGPRPPSSRPSNGPGPPEPDPEPAPEPEPPTSSQPAPPRQGGSEARFGAAPWEAPASPMPGGFEARFGQPSFIPARRDGPAPGWLAAAWEAPAPARPATGIRSSTTPRDRRAASDSGPSGSAYPPLNQSQSRLDVRSETERRRTVPAPSSRYPPPGSNTRDDDSLGDDDPGETVAICDGDGCGRDIGSNEHWVDCTVCYDYDLCARCYMSGVVSKNHSGSHKVNHVMNTLVLGPDDLVPARPSVNPPDDPVTGRKNWTLVSVDPNTPANPTDLTVTLRNLHLYNNDSHARFRAYARPGHYGVAITIQVFFDPAVEANALLRQQLLRRPGGTGTLLVTLGVLKNNQQFAGTRFAEDSFSGTMFPPDSLPNKLLCQGFCGSALQLGVRSAIYTLQPETLLHVAGGENSLIGIGLVVQWSGVAWYQQFRNPIASVTVLNLRLNNLLDYNEPYVRAAVPPQLLAVTPPPPATNPGDEDEDEDGGSDDPTAEEFLAALLQIQRAAETAEEKARLEALVKQRLAQQERAKREAVARLYIQTTMTEVMRQAAVEEERRREEENLLLFLRSLGMR